MRLSSGLRPPFSRESQADEWSEEGFAGLSSPACQSLLGSLGGWS